MAVSNRTQMVFTCDNSIIVSNGQPPSVMSARQPSVKSIRPIIDKFCIKPKNLTVATEYFAFV